MRGRLTFLIYFIYIPTILCNNLENYELVSCSNLNCKNNSTCIIDKFGNAECQCSSNWFGNECERKVCAGQNPCQNRGFCEKTELSFHCYCPAGYVGRYCERKIPTICDTDPCEFGKCRALDLFGNYVCICNFAFTGKNCSEYDSCATNYCQYGDCLINDYGYECSCYDGFTGEMCDQKVDKCLDNPCKNGGKCINGNQGYFYCDCPLGYTGLNCETKYNIPNECSPNPCLNEGHCHLKASADFSSNFLAFFGINSLSNEVDSQSLPFKCECQNGRFYGDRCEQKVDNCTNGVTQCFNGGVCIQGLDKAYCKCPREHEGEHCEFDVDECQVYGENRVCHNGGICENEFGAFSCQCPIGFRGPLCEINIDECIDNLCYAGSRCIDGNFSYTCVCTPDRYGMLCEYENICYTNKSICNNHGFCTIDYESGDYSCHCYKGYKGSNCQEEIDLCDGNPCGNGICYSSPSSDSYRCECDAGFGGPKCQQLLTNCASNPCRNGALCTDLFEFNNYVCTCTTGFTGKNCDTPVLPQWTCQLSCENGGVCRDFKCLCPIGYTGDRCELLKNPCDENDCQNESECQPNGDFSDYICKCGSNFTGLKCEFLNNELCNNSSCVHGTCQSSSDTTKTYLNKTYCQCDIGYEGVLCDQIKKLPTPNQNDCTKNLCQNGGKCHLTEIGFVCECSNHFYGNFCEHVKTSPPPPTTIVRLINDCRKNPAMACQNNGKCIHPAILYVNSTFTANEIYNNLDEEFKCECLPGFSGEYCQYDINECLKKPCLNGGQCIDLVNDFQCRCLSGFTGKNCEINIDDCQHNKACLNGGTCVDGLNNFKCECTHEFTGNFCEIRVDVSKFNKTDENKKEECLRNNCSKKLGNGICDSECNFFACDYDGGDCSAQIPNPFKNCLQASYCAHKFKDGKCDEICNNENCLFDGFDCEQKLENCTKLHFCSKHYGNKNCDSDCNNIECGWDGGDCDGEQNSKKNSSESEIKPKDFLDGQLSLFLRGDLENLIQKLPEILIELSRYLQVSVSIVLDSNGHPLIQKWQQIPGIGEIMENINFDRYKDIKFKQENKERSTETLNNEGIHILLEVDVAMCHSAQNSTVENSCFSQIETISSLLAIGSATNSLGNISNVIYKSEARRDTTTNIDSENSYKYVAFFAMLFTCFLLIVLMVQIQINKNKRSISHKHTWIPPIYNPGKKDQYDETTSTSLDSNNTNTYSSNKNNYGFLPNGTYTQKNFSTNYCGQIPQLLHQQQELLNNWGGSTNSLNVYGNLYDIRNNNNNKYLPTDNLRSNNNNVMAIQSPNSSSGVSSGNVSPDNLNNGYFPLHSLLQTFNGIKDLQKTHDIAEMVNTRDSNYSTPLLTMLRYAGSEDGFKNVEDVDLKQAIIILKDFGADINAQDKDGNTILILAIKQGRFHLCQEIIKHANLKLADAEGKTALHHAVALLQIDIIKLLINFLEQSDVNALTKQNETPLMKCCKTMRGRANQGDEEIGVQIARLLIEKGANVDSTGNEYNSQRTALHWAAAHNNVPMINLLKEFDADINAIDADNHTPIFLAALNDHEEAVKVLKEFGADCKILNDPDNKFSPNIKLILETSSSTSLPLSDVTYASNSALISRHKDLEIRNLDGQYIKKRTRNLKKEVIKNPKKQYIVSESYPQNQQQFGTYPLNSTNISGTSTIYTPPASDQSTYSPSPGQQNFPSPDQNVSGNSSSSSTNIYIDRQQIENVSLNTDLSNFTATSSTNTTYDASTHYNSPPSDYDNTNTVISDQSNYLLTNGIPSCYNPCDITAMPTPNAMPTGMLTEQPLPLINFNLSNWQQNYNNNYNL